MGKPKVLETIKVILLEQGKPVWFNGFPEMVSSAKFAGITERVHPNVQRFAHVIKGDLPMSQVETWVVTGPGLKRAGDGFIQARGTWRVYAGTWDANAIDGPAMLASRELERMLPEEAHC